MFNVICSPHRKKNIKHINLYYFFCNGYVLLVEVIVTHNLYIQICIALISSNLQWKIREVLPTRENKVLSILTAYDDLYFGRFLMFTQETTDTVCFPFNLFDIFNILCQVVFVLVRGKNAVLLAKIKRKVLLLGFLRLQDFLKGR